MNRITEITKRDILDLFQNGLEIDEFFQTRTVTYNYYGRLEEIDFLKRLYDLERMPSFDSRFANAEQDIWQHTVNNDDYPYCWVFEDKRFNLQDGSDEVYLKFLCEVFHPAVRYDKGYWKEFLVATNKLLQNDGYEIYPAEKISNRDVYGWRIYQQEDNTLFEEGIDSSQTSGKLLISVLSAVAEIERENIIEQTMNGRREKARQGGWNGGFAPYGYYLKDNQLLIEETEAEAIRIIFDKFANSDIGLGGVAKYLNLQGIKKIPRQNGTLETWSSHFIRLILDNPVYCGKIAYGRRTREKVKGTKNEYKQVHAEDYILEDGQHEGIISEELWQKVHAKRMATGIKQPSKIGKDRSHLLTGILKCPLCGSSMYTNKHAWTNKDGTYKEVYYYICGRNKQERGHHCDYKASLRKTDIEPLVIEAVKELVSDKYFAKEIEKRIGVQTDTTAIDKELANYESKLKEVDLNKARLEREIDNLPIDARFRERKIHDMTLRLDALYDTIVELEERIEDAKLRKSSIEMETITLDNIYKLMLNFGKLYDIISDEEKKSLITYLIKEIQIYPNGESEMPLKSIEFNFPIYRDGQEVRRLLWEKGNTVETVVLLSQQKPDDVIEVEIELDELDLTSAESKATYAEIKEYVLKEHGLKVPNLYISQVKRKCGIEVGENYNLPKSEDSRQPQCPEEKEKAIRDALEHFGMI